MRTINVIINTNGSINADIPQMYSNESNANKMTVHAPGYISLDAYIDFNLNGVLYRSDKQTWDGTKFEFILEQIICVGIVKAQFVFIDAISEEVLKTDTIQMNFKDSINASEWLPVAMVKDLTLN